MDHLQQLLDQYACVVKYQEEVIYTSTAIGVKPLMVFYKEHGSSHKDLTVIDRIMGKGAVMLAILVGARELITPIMSQSAYDYAQKYDLTLQVEKVVPMIINRSGDGQCPIELAVLEIEDLQQGYKAISKAIEVLMKASH